MSGRHFDIGPGLYVDVRGDESAPTIVLLASLGADLTMWENNVASLVDAGNRVVRIDLRGQGRSASGAIDWTLERLADDVIEVLDNLGTSSATICGCSLGGLVAQAIGLRHPDRTRALILVGTASRFAPATRWNDRIASVRDNGIAAIADSALTRWISCQTRRKCPELVDRLRSVLLSTDVDSFCQMARILRDTDLGGQLHTLDTPTLILVGEHDIATPVACSEHLREAIPGARLEVTPAAAHLANVDQPKAFEDAVSSFLENATFFRPVDRRGTATSFCL